MNKEKIKKTPFYPLNSIYVLLCGNNYFPNDETLGLQGHPLGNDSEQFPK
jgi:hypothetical protein